MINSFPQVDVDLSQSYPVCEAGVSGLLLVLVLVQLLPQGPALLQLADLRALTWDQETEVSTWGITMTDIQPGRFIIGFTVKSKLCVVPAGCSARLRVMICRMRLETGVGVTPDSCPSPRSVLSPELPSD